MARDKTAAINRIMNHDTLTLLRTKAKIIRKDVMQMLHYAGSGHPGGSLSAADIVAALYFHEMRLNPKSPNWPQRDFFVLSKGHSCPVVYAALAESGFFSKDWYNGLRHINGALQGHPDRKKTPGIEFNSGSLSQGFSFGLGRALAYKHTKDTNRVYILMGCGEQDEGQVWEGAMFGAHYKLNNVLAIVDYNQLQSDDTNDHIMMLKPLAEKWRSFGWNVFEIDGHNMEQILGAFADARGIRLKPSVIIASTIKGKGVSFMENVPKWHGSLAPTADELKLAMAELDNDQ